MTALLNWLASDGGRALLLALAHSIWIGGLAWAALALLFRRLSARRCEMRYVLALGAQGLVFGLTLFLWSWFAHAAGETRVGPAPGPLLRMRSLTRKPTKRLRHWPVPQAVRWRLPWARDLARYRRRSCRRLWMPTHGLLRTGHSGGA